MTTASLQSSLWRLFSDRPHRLFIAGGIAPNITRLKGPLFAARAIAGAIMAQLDTT